MDGGSSSSPHPTPTPFLPFTNRFYNKVIDIIPKVTLTSSW